MANVWQANYWAGGSRTYNSGHNGYDSSTGYCNLVGLGQMIAGRYSSKDNVTCLRFACNDNSYSKLHFYINNYSSYSGQGTVKILVKTSELSSVTKSALEALGSITMEYTCVNSTSGYSELNEFDLTYNFVKGTIYYIYIWGKDSDTWRFRWYPPDDTYSGFAVTYTTAIFTISYNANGGSGAPPAQQKDWGVNLTLSTIKPTKGNSTGSTYTMTFNGNGGVPSKENASATSTISYTFKNWNTASNGSGTSYSSGAEYTGNASITLYAQYISSTSYGTITTATASKSPGTSTRTVAFDATTNGGISNPASKNSTATITYSPKDNSWYSAASGGSIVAAMGVSYTISATQTVYAQWNSSTGTYSTITLPSASKNNTYNYYYVSFDVNGGNSSHAKMTSTQTTTYSLKGWYTSASGGTKRENGYTPSTSETLYAQFNSSSGAYSAISLPTPTRSGYKFLGWAESPTAANGITGSYVPTKTLTLYAIWEALGSVKIQDGTEVHRYIPYIYTNNKWVRAIPYVYTNGEWKRAGGG